MSDLQHQFGSDLSVGPTGDVVSDGIGTVSVQVNYTDAETNATQVLGFTLGDGT